MSTRTRLSREARQDQLLDLGTQLFADRSYEDVHIEELSEVAGVSKGLLYHYFPNKRAFFAAMVKRESSRMADVTATDPEASAMDQLRSGVEAYLDYCRANRMGVKAMFRGAASADAEVQAILDQDISTQAKRILAAIGPGEPSEALKLAVRGWVHMLHAMSLDWLDAENISRDEVRDLAVTILVTTLKAVH